MRLAFVRSEKESGYFDSAHLSNAPVPEELKISAKAGSSSKNIILELLRLGLIDEAFEWKFWDRPTADVNLPGLLPVRLFELRRGASGLEREIAERGPPDILWVEGPEHPFHLRHVFEHCPPSFKIVYSKDWKPWKVEQLQRYDLVLVDEAWQAERVHKQAPNVHTGVWDKLIDYEGSHYPVPAEKQYDLCYVAYMRPRKNHRLLLEAMSRLPGRRLRALFLGGDRKGMRARLEKHAQSHGLDVTFLGEVPKDEVNLWVNRSRIGVMLAEKDAAPRVILEYMAANVPVLVNQELRAGARYVDERSGLVLPPERLHEGIEHILANYDSYTPRQAYLERFSRERVIDTFLAVLRGAGLDLRQRSLPSAQK